MPLDDSIQQLAWDVIAGFDNAAELYHRLSGGWELHKAPEYYCTVKVAEKLADRENRYATLEQNITETLAWSGGGKGEDRTAYLPDAWSTSTLEASAARMSWRSIRSVDDACEGFPPSHLIPAAVHFRQARYGIREGSMRSGTLPSRIEAG